MMGSEGRQKPDEMFSYKPRSCGGSKDVWKRLDKFGYIYCFTSSSGKTFLQPLFTQFALCSGQAFR